MKEILRRREEQQQGRKKPPAGPVATAGKGASAGVKSKNKYMQDFEKAKAGFKKKKGIILRSLSCLQLFILRSLVVLRAMSVAAARSRQAHPSPIRHISPSHFRCELLFVCCLYCILESYDLIDL